MDIRLWPMTTVGELLSSSGGSIKTGPFGTTLKASEYSAQGVPLISVGEVGFGRIILHSRTPKVSPQTVSRLPDYVLRTNDIVFGRKGAVERSAIVKPEENGWFLGSDGIRLRLPDSCDARFVSYQFLTAAHRSWMIQHSTGTTMRSLNQKIIERIPLVVPPLPEQQAIAEVLGALDDKIELNRRMNATLEELARSIFRSWFVDFDPNHAKAEGRAPFGMDADTAALFSDSFVPSELGDIPAGWAVEALTSSVRVMSGGTPKTQVADYWGGTIPWFSVVDAPPTSDVFVVDTQKHITQSGLDSCSALLLPRRTTILSARGTVGKVGLTAVPMAMNQSCYALVGTLDQSQIHTYFLTRSLVNQMQQQAHGSVFDTITRSTLDGLRIVAPHPELLRPFDKLVVPLIDRIEMALHESRTLAELRDTLLPKLLSGEITVKVAERELMSAT